jgi:hypothetical protein
MIVIGMLFVLVLQLAFEIYSVENASANWRTADRCGEH